MKNISLLYLTYIENPFAPETKGVMSAQVKALLKELGKNNSSLTIRWLALASTKFYTPNAQEIEMYQKELAECHVTFDYHSLDRVGYIGNIKQASHIFSNVLETYSPDIVHCRVYPGTFFTLIHKFLGQKRFKIIFDGRGVYPEQLQERSKGLIGKVRYVFWKFVEKLLLAYTDVAVGVTPFYQNYLKSLAPQAKVDYIPCCVDSSQFDFDYDTVRQKLRQDLSIAESKTVFVYSGTLSTKYSSPAVLANILNHVDNLCPEAGFLILTKSTLQEFKGFLTEKVFEKLIVKSLEPQDVPHYLVCSDIGILVREASLVNSVAMPIKLGEYLAAGLPILCSSSLEGVAQIISDNKVGQVFSLTDIHSVHLDQLYNIDKKTCIHVANNFSATAVSKKYTELYDSLARDSSKINP